MNLVSRVSSSWYATALLGLVVALATSCGGPRLPEPVEQPIAYSHKAHVTKEGELVCSRCHPGAEKAKNAGLTPLRTCASCHRRIATDHPEVQKVMAAWEEKTPILWQRVNIIPDSAMVHFNHGAHFRAGVECIECHGDVKTMTVARAVLQVADMGWCIGCHREREVSDDCLVCHY